MTNHPHLDPEIITTLREVMGDDYVLLIETFMSDSAMRIQTMKQTIADQHKDGLRRAAHSLKGSSSNVGAWRLAELCSVMESLAMVGNSHAWLAQLDLIETELMDVTRLLH